MERFSSGTVLFRSAAKLAVVVLLLLGLGRNAHGQSTASLNGTVTDPSGNFVAGAKVTVTNQATGVASSSETDAAGGYLFPSLPIGLYRIEFNAPGFETGVIKDFKLDVAMVVTKNLQLTVGQVTEQVVITADAAQVETATPSLGQVINDKTVQDIPLNGRHFTDLSLLTPGTMTPPANGFLSAPLRGQGSFGINTGGAREDTTNWLVNGINLNDPVQNQVTFQPPIDTLAEYKIDNNSYPAQYGRNSGAIVNLATRSGTNEYHGELFEFFRNNDLDARNFFNPALSSSGTPLAQAPFKRNDFGVDFGGPIKKNKMFFFLAYEGLRQRQGLTVTSTVPSATQIAAVTSPAVQALLALVPAANLVGTGTAGNPSTFNFFSGSTAANVSLNQGSADLDYDISDTDRVHGYYVVQKDLRQEPTSGTNLPKFGDTRSGFRQLMTISEDHTFNASLTNTIRLGYNRIHLFFTPNNSDAASAFDIGLPGGVPSGALPNIIVGGAMSFGGPAGEPQGRGDTTVVLNDGLSWLVGRNSFQFGGEIRRAYNDNVAENIGSFTYSNLAAFLSDSAATFSTQIGAGNDKIVEPAYALFAQDTFKWTSRFTLNFGLRYEWNSTPFETQSRFTNFNMADGTLVPAGQPFATNNKNFEPRVGIAWDPFGNGKTSVRAAYAILTQDPTTNVLTGLSGNPPFAVPVSVTSGGVTLENPSAGIAGVSLGPTAIAPNFKNMYAQDWNLTVERELTPSMIVTLAYVGDKGTHLQLTQNVNQPLVTNGFYGSAHPFLLLPTTSPVFPTECVPDCTFGAINRINSVGNSNYNALWATVNKHFSHNFEFLASYTWSKSQDYNSLSTGETIPLQNAYNPRGDYGLSQFDARNRFVLSGFYKVPFQRNRLVSGWQFGIVTQAQSGNPINPTLTINTPISITVRPDLLAHVTGTGSPAQYLSNHTVCEPFNGTPTGGPPAIAPCASTSNAAFAVPCTFSDIPVSNNPMSTNFKVYPIVPGSCHPGNMGRDAITGPDFLNTDFSITKDTKITERFTLEFRSEMFDVFNHPNFGNPVLTVTSGSFGNIQSTRFPTGDFGSSRQIAFALKLMF